MNNVNIEDRLKSYLLPPILDYLMVIQLLTYLVIPLKVGSRNRGLRVRDGTLQICLTDALTIETTFQQRLFKA